MIFIADISSHRQQLRSIELPVGLGVCDGVFAKNSSGVGPATDSPDQLSDFGHVVADDNQLSSFGHVAADHRTRGTCSDTLLTANKRAYLLNDFMRGPCLRDFHWADNH